MRLRDLRRWFRYEPETGEFYWLRDRLAGKGGVRARAGARAGKTEKNGYRVLTLDGKRFKAHRVAWAFVNGRFPRRKLNHCNHNRADNRIGNLREASESDIACNRRRATNNTSGFKGVSFHKGAGKWAAQIKLNGRRRYIGLFQTPELAHVAYCNAAKELHGSFANTGREQ